MPKHKQATISGSEAPLERQKLAPPTRVLHLSQFGKCHVIQHTSTDDQERRICLNCPYPRCLLEGLRTRRASKPRP